MAFVEQLGANVFYRGPMPVTAAGTFAHEELLATLPKTKRLVILSCLTYEREDEAAFLTELTKQERPPRRRPILAHNCTIYFWQVRAHTPPGTHIDLATQRFEGHLLDFPGLIETLTALMHSPTPTTIYLHCRHGLNRTGAVTIAYLMRAHGLSLHDAYTRNLTYHPKHIPTYIYQPTHLLAYLNLYSKQYLLR